MTNRLSKILYIFYIIFINYNSGINEKRIKFLSHFPTSKDLK